MKISLEGIKKENRNEYRKIIYSIDESINTIAFADEGVAIEIREPYLISDEWLEQKSRIKKDIILKHKEFIFNQFYKG